MLAEYGPTSFARLTFIAHCGTVCAAISRSRSVVLLPPGTTAAPAEVADDSWRTFGVGGSAPADATLASRCSGPQIGYSPVRTHFLSNVVRLESGQKRTSDPRS